MTAVDWLWDEIVVKGSTQYVSLLDKARAMNEQQFVDAFKAGNKHTQGWLSKTTLDDAAKKYYNEKYK